MPGRRVSLIGIRGYLPAIDPTSGDVATSEAFARLVASRADGTRQRVVFDLAGADRYRGPDSVWEPSWSKDGQWLASSVGPPFAAGNVDVDIWKIRAEGREAADLTLASEANDAFPDFSPDGRRIVFRSMRDGNAEIYVITADGDGVQRLTHHGATDTMPEFSSAGDRVAFTSLRDGAGGPERLSTVTEKSVILDRTSTTTCRGCMGGHRRQEPVWPSVRGAGVKAVSPAERGRSEATRLDAGEHTLTLLA